MKNEKTITVAMFEKETDKQVGFNEKKTINSPFDVATSDLKGYIDTIYKFKTRGTKEHFIVFVMVNKDNPTRIDFEVEYGPKEWRASWEVPETIDTFPTNDFTTDGKRIFLNNFQQAQRFSTYKDINDTFENRIRVRLNRRLGSQKQTGWCSYDSVEPDLEWIDYVTRLAKENNAENVVKWAIDDEYKRGGQSSGKEIRDTIDLVITTCSREISILRTIYEMENKQAKCPEIVVKAKELLEEYDKQDASTMRANLSAP